MTYNQIVKEIRTVLENNAFLHSVKFATPTEWINWEGVPELPIGLYAINQGTFDMGYQNSYNVEVWLLDKSGVEGEFETEVISDMHQVANDIVNAISLSSAPYAVQKPITWTAISDKFEDYISGITFVLTIQTNGEFSYCDFPTTT